MYFYGGCSAGARVAGPHAVCTVGTTTYTYDDNGNMTGGGGRSVTYNTRGKVSGVENGAASAAFGYGADENRVVQVSTSSGVTSRTVYVGLGGTGKSMFEQTTTGGTPTYVNFVYAGTSHGGNAFAVVTMDWHGAVTGHRYFNFDHLGSTTAVSDEEGTHRKHQRPRRWRSRLRSMGRAPQSGWDVSGSSILHSPSRA